MSEITTKQEFLAELRRRLEGLPEPDVQASVDYYAEMLEDMTEGGATEAEAVASLGSAEFIAEQILLDMPLPKLVKARVKPKRRLRAWEIVLIAVGSPVWLPILLALGAVILAVYIVLWTAGVCLYAADLCLAVGGLAGVLGCIFLFATAHPALALMMLGAGLVCGGLAIFGFFGCNYTAKGILWLGKMMWRGVKACFVRKERVQ